MAGYGILVTISGPDKGKGSWNFFQIVAEILGCHYRYGNFSTGPANTKYLAKYFVKFLSSPFIVYYSGVSGVGIDFCADTIARGNGARDLMDFSKDIIDPGR